MAKNETLGRFEQLVLTAVLLLQEKAYAVAVHRKMEELTDPKPVSLGAVYATLDRLEDKGLLTSRLLKPTPERGGRAKRCYTVPARGERLLQDSIVSVKRVCAALEGVWEEGA